MPDITVLCGALTDAEQEGLLSAARKQGVSAVPMAADALDMQQLKETKVLQVSSAVLAAEQGRAAMWQALITAKGAGAAVSYDPGYDASLWPSDEAACDQIRSILPVVDIIKLSEADMPYASGIDEADTAVKVLWREGVSLVIITLGEKGVLLAAAGEQRLAPAVKRGAEDAFLGGFLAELIKSGKSVYEVTVGDMERFAASAAAPAK